MATKEELKEKLARTEAASADWLASGNQFLEVGNHKRHADKCFDRAKYWLDKANAIRDQILTM